MIIGFMLSHIFSFAQAKNSGKSKFAMLSASHLPPLLLYVDILCNFSCFSIFGIISIFLRANFFSSCFRSFSFCHFYIWHYAFRCWHQIGRIIQNALNSIFTPGRPDQHAYTSSIITCHIVHISNTEIKSVLRHPEKNERRKYIFSLIVQHKLWRRHLCDGAERRD